MPVARPAIEITTSIDPHQPDELSIARRTFGARIAAEGDTELGDGLSDAAVTLWFRAARRGRVAGSHAASIGETKITIAARGLDPESLVIEPIADPSARLLGPEPNEP